MNYIGEIIVAVLALIGSVIGSALANNKTQALIGYRIDELEKKVEKHNNVIERVYNLEKNEAVMEEEIKVANHRIDDLEGYHK